MARPAVRRSTLILPVHVERFVSNAWRRGADLLTLDLEDSVAPSAKAEARAAVRDAIPVAARGGAAISVRVNRETWREDIEASVWPGLDSISFPKAESAEELREVDALITRLERERGIEPGSVSVSAAIETVEGLLHAAEIASSSPRVGGAGGPAAVDFAADLGIELDPSIDQLEPMRGELDLIARAGGGRGGGRWRRGRAITEYGDEAGVLASSAVSRRDGSRGSAGIHPSVIGPFNRGYTPSPEEEAEAREVVEAFEAAWADRRGWAEVRGRLVSRRRAEAARAYLEYAEACRAADAAKRARGIDVPEPGA